MKETVKKQDAIAFLKMQWRNGMRWVAYKNVRIIKDVDTFCCKDYKQAVSFCKENNLSSEMSYTISVITDLLGKLTNTKKHAYGKGVSKKELCKQYPQLSFPYGAGNTDTIPMDTYFPVVWNRIINNLTDISQWLVTSNRYKNKILFRSGNYEGALEYFIQSCHKVASNGLRETITLQAKTVGLADGIVVVYEFYYYPRRVCYLLDMKTDASKPFLYPIYYFSKYNNRLKRLEFFDGELKRIQAGKIFGISEIQYYHPTDSVIYSNYK